MKRKFKRIASLVLAMVMVFAMAMPAMAANVYNGEELSLTITNVASGNHTFKAFQIFTGDLNESTITNVGESNETATAGTMLSNIKWGSGLNDAGKRYLMGRAGVDDAEHADLEASLPKVVEWLDSLKAADLDAICKGLVSAGGLGIESASATVGTEQSDDTYNYVISPLATGYYMVTDAITGTEGTDDAVSAYLVDLVYSRSVVTKSSVPEVNKTVSDVNDSDGTTAAKDKTADYDLGDDVPFELTGKIGQNYTEYQTYYFAFHDKQSKGLTFNSDSVVVTVDSDPVTMLVEDTDYKVVTSGLSDGCAFEIVFDNLKAVPSVKAGSTITVTYTSKLNDQAVLGNNGNPNEVHLEYSNNPNTPTEHGTTPPSTVVVFTFDVTVNKKDDKGNSLAGAEFTLEKWVRNNLTDPAGKWVDAGQLVKTDEGKTFNFEFVDDGIYRLTETKTPDGYNTIDPIYIKVTATHTMNAEGTEGKVALTAVTGTYDETTGVFTEGGDGSSLTVNAGETVDIAGKTVGTNGQASTDVVNHKGATLPETGGIGTTIFYVVGSVLVLGAVILLVTKRRMKD